mgnify:CR=1 FL=1
MMIDTLTMGTVRAALITSAYAITRDAECFTADELAEVAGIRKSIVQDHLKEMVVLGQVERRARGVYYHPHARRDDCPVSVTVKPDGSHLIERGDEKMTVNRHEARLLKMALGNTSVVLAQDGPSEPVTITVLLDGTQKLEVGERVMELSPREARMLKTALG